MLFLLEPGNVISILISSDFLKMDSLVSKQNYNKYDNFPVTSVVRLKLFCHLVYLTVLILLLIFIQVAYFS